MTDPSRLQDMAMRGRARVSVLIAAAALLFAALNIGVTYAVVPFPSPLDELQHMSFVRDLEAQPALFPRYERLRALTPDLSHPAGPLFVSHPAPYYLAMAAIDGVAHSPASLRLANAALALSGVALMLAAGFRALADVPQRAIYAALVVLFPKLGIVGALINNDNAGLLATGLGVLALVRWNARPGDWLLAAALAAAGWTKLTVFLMLGSGFVIAELLAGRGPQRVHLRALLGGAVGAAPTLVNLARYRSPVWPGPSHFAQMAGRQTATPLEYAGFSVRELAASWSALQPSSAVAVFGLILVLGLGAAAVVVGARRWPVAAGLILATLPVLALQVWFGWTELQREGFLDLVPSRYYYGVWPGWALGIAHLWPLRPGPARAVIAAVTGAALVMSSAAFCIGLAMAAGVFPGR